jgi:hypothetical protein
MIIIRRRRPSQDLIDVLREIRDRLPWEDFSPEQLAAATQALTAANVSAESRPTEEEEV